MVAPRVAIVGNGRLAPLLAARVRARGQEALGAASSVIHAWPDEVPVTVFQTADELSESLAAQRPGVVVVFGPTVGESLAVPATAIVQAAGSISGARLVYWGSASVYGRPAQVRGRVLLESAALGGAAYSEGATRADRAVQELLATGQPKGALFRAAEVVGAGQSEFLAAVGRLTLVPTPASHRYVQLLDPRDAVQVLERAVGGGHPGVYNVSADGIVKVDEMCRALGRSSVRLPGVLLPAIVHGARWTGKVASARALAHLTAGTAVLDNGRLKTHFGFRPRFTTRQALAAARDEAASLTV